MNLKTFKLRISDFPEPGTIEIIKFGYACFDKSLKIVFHSSVTRPLRSIDIILATGTKYFFKEISYSDGKLKFDSILLFVSFISTLLISSDF